MTNFVTFGCSNTFGHGQYDCLNNTKPSSLAWPSILSNISGIGHINISQPGWTNIDIALAVLSHDFNAGDIAIILWSYPERDTIVTDNGNHRVYPEVDSKLARNFYGAHTVRDLELRSWIYQDLVGTNLTLAGIPFIMATCSYWNPADYIGNNYINVDDVFEGKWTVLHPLRSIKVSMNRLACDLAADGMHAGPITHSEWAKMIRNKLVVLDYI